MRAENFLVSAMLENGARVYPRQGAYVGLFNAGKCGCRERGQRSVLWIFRAKVRGDFKVEVCPSFLFLLWFYHETSYKRENSCCCFMRRDFQ